MIVISHDSIKINASDIWQIYMAIKLHFQSSSKFDAFKFNFRGPRLKPGSRNESRSKWALEKLSKKYPRKNDIILYFLANILGGKEWIGDMNEDIYSSWIAKIQRMEYSFKCEIFEFYKVCIEKELSFDDAFISKDNVEVPLIYKMLYHGKISLESLVILQSLIRFVKNIENTMSDPLGIIGDINNKILQYQPFLKEEINLNNSRNIIIKTFKN